MSWTVLFSSTFEDWHDGLPASQQQAIEAAVEKLEEFGPALGRPLVDSIKGSKYKHMKELRPLGGYNRILFAFDPERHAVLLVGGNKARRWNVWYKENLPLAEKLYALHLAGIK
jgi:hypothetical protein